MSLAAGTRLGPYEILAPIAAGGMGEVYRGRDTRLDRIVAVKVLTAWALSPDARQRFEREARAISRLNHPHICALYDLGHQDDVEFLVMEYVEGETLTARLTSGPLPVQNALRCAIEIAEAIDAAHRAGVVHRDLKPGNIMLTRSGVKLLDFGLAKLRASEPAPGSPANEPTELALTTDGAIVGTVQYMAPEQLEGKEVDSRTDLFALGVVIYEMVTGRRPFSGDSKARVIISILTEEPPPMTELQHLTPAPLERLVRTCLAKDRNERWQNAGDLVRELKWIAEEQLRGTKLPSGAVAVGRSLITPRLRRIALPALAVLLAVAVAVPLLWRRTLPSPPRHLVVLPCKALGGEATDQAYCDGLTETLTAKLSRLTAAHALQVTPVSEVRQQGVTNVEEARKRLGATLTLEGSLLRSQSRLRATYALVDAATHLQLDACSADAADAFTLQDQIAACAVRALQLTLNPPERDALFAREARGGGAYEAYLQGRGFLLQQRDPESADKAIGQFRRAAQLDPRYAPAYAGLGVAYWWKYRSSNDAQWVAQAGEACQQALSLDARLAAAHICLGTLHNGTGQYEKAIEDFQRALESEPTSDEAHVGLALAREQTGNVNAAEKTYRRAIELRPDYWAGHHRLANFYRNQSRYEEAAREYERMVALAPDVGGARAILGSLYVYLGRYDDAIAAFRKATEIEPGDRSAYTNWGMTYFRLRSFDEAVALLEQARALRSDYRTWGNLARAYYWSGRRVQALELYEGAVRLGQDALAVNPRDVEVRLSLADFCAKLDRKEEALGHLQQASFGNDPHALFFAAMVYNQLGDRSTALNRLEEAVARRLPRAELQAWVELDNLRSEPRFQALSRSR